MGMHFDFMKKTSKMRPFDTVEQYEEFEADCCKLPDIEAEVRAAAAKGKSRIQKGMNELGERFDSSWEFAVATYFRRVEGLVVERNRSEWLPYFTEDGKMHKWFVDFKVGSLWVEVKGQMKHTDQLKMAAHPDVRWIFGEEVISMERQLDARFPEWRNMWIRTN